MVISRRFFIFGWCLFYCSETLQKGSALQGWWWAPYLEILLRMKHRMRVSERMLGTAGRSWRPAPFLNHFLKTNAWRSAIKSQLLDQLLIIVYLWYLCAQTVRLNTRSCTQHSSSRPRSPSFQWHRCQAPKRLLQMPPSVGQNMPLQSIYVGNVSPNVLNVNTYVKQMMSVCTCQITAVYACQYNPIQSTCLRVAEGFVNVSCRNMWAKTYVQVIRQCTCHWKHVHAYVFARAGIHVKQLITHGSASLGWVYSRTPANCTNVRGAHVHQCVSPCGQNMPANMQVHVTTYLSKQFRLQVRT